MVIDLNLVTRYVRLQEGLLAELSLSMPEEPSRNLRGKGALTYDGGEWFWGRHGAGIRFRSPEGIVVDAHDYFFCSEAGQPNYTFGPGSFDLLRLRWFLKSIGEEDCEFGTMLSAIMTLVEGGDIVELTKQNTGTMGRRFCLR